jgi:unsaturated rhamnogalacturonyl hydrolase
MKFKLNYSFLLFGLMILNSGITAQNTDKEILLRVSDYIIKNTGYKFINKSTGEIYSATENLPVNKDIGIKDQYNFWQYPNGIINMAMEKLYVLTGDEKYHAFPIKYYAFFFQNFDFMKRMYDAGFQKWDFYWFFRMKQLDDCGPHASGLIDVYKDDPKPVYKVFLENTATLIMEKSHRLKDGTWAKPIPRVSTVWLDDLYMGVSFLAKWGHEQGKNEYIDSAARQIIRFNKYLYDPVSGLYYHNYYADIQRPGIAHWGRANGWSILAQVSLLEYLPKDHPLRDSLLFIFDRQVYGLSKYQSETGLWHQLLDKPDSYPETSCTAMFTYAIAKGVNEGWIDKRYASIAIEGWKGIITKIDKEGAVLDVCAQTGISDDLVFYYKRPAPFNDFHATGTIMLAGIEIMKLKENLKKTTK